MDSGEIECMPRVPSRAASTIAETASEAGTEVDPRIEIDVESIQAKIGRDTERLIGRERRMKREERLTLTVEMLERKHPNDSRVQTLARNLKNTRIQTIRLDSRNKSRQLSDRQGNQLLTYAYMIGYAHDELGALGEDAVAGGVDAVIAVARRAIWDQEGPGSSHSAKAMIPFLSCFGIYSSSDLPRTLVGFAELALYYALEMQRMIFEEVMEQQHKMRSILEGVVHDASTMDLGKLQMAYRAHQLNLGPTAPMVSMAVPMEAVVDTTMETAVTAVPYLHDSTTDDTDDTDDDEDDNVTLTELKTRYIAASSSPPIPISTTPITSMPSIFSPMTPRDNYFHVTRLPTKKRARVEVDLTN